MSASSVVQSVPPQATVARVNVVRAVLKAFVLFLLFSGVYQLLQPVKTGTLPTFYNHLIDGRERLYWSNQTNLPLLINDHIIQQATADTWNVIMLGSSETYGDMEPDNTAISALNGLNLRAGDGRRVRFYNLAMPISDVWKDLIIAESVLQAGLPIDTIILNTWSYAFQNDYPHKLVIYNPTIAATVVDRYHLDPALFAYSVSKGVQNLWSDRAILSAWLFDQSRALAWHLGVFDYGNRNEPPEALKASLGIAKNLPISREEFLGAFRQMAERYDTGLLVVNVPRPLDEDDFADWLQARAKTDRVAMLECEFIFAGHPSRFIDGVHLMPESFPLYGRILAKHFSRPEMADVWSGSPLQLPDDFVTPDEECSFSPS